MNSLEDFNNLGESIAHFAVKRKLGYFHHYIVIASKDATKKVWEYFICFATWLKGGGEVKEQDIKEKDVKKDIEEGNLYVIEAPNYPKTDEEKDKAKQRFLERFGENAYALAYNNCEHLVSYILTGVPYSEQIKEAGEWIMCKVDAASIAINFTWHELKCLTTIPAKRYIGAAVSCVKNKMENFTVAAVKNGCKKQVQVARAAAKKLNCNPTNILKNRQCVNVAKNASKDTFSTLVTAGTVEAVFSAYEIYCLIKQNKNGQIKDCTRAVANSVAGAVGATIGSAVGGAVAQALFPVPGIGYFLGSAVGNFFGRVGASVLVGQIYDNIMGK